jgi:hypothetical protein
MTSLGFGGAAEAALNSSRGTPAFTGTDQLAVFVGGGLAAISRSVSVMLLFVAGQLIWTRCGSTYWPVASGP